MVPIITDAEKIKRRDNVKAKRRRTRQKVQALAAAKARLRPVLEGVQGRLLLQRGRESISMWRSRMAITSAAGKLLRREADQAAVPEGRPARGLGGWGGVDSRADAVALRRVGCVGLGLLPLERKRSSRAAQGVWRGIAGRQSVGGRTDACVQARGMRGGLGATPPVADGVARQGEAQSGGSVAALHLGAQGR